MTRLQRTVRFSPDLGPWGVNGEAGSPPIRGLGRHYEVDVECIGDIAPETGYLVNIKQIDAAVRDTCIPLLARACAEEPATPPARLLARLVREAEAALPCRLASLRWRLTPYYSIEMSPRQIKRALVRQRFEFAASHRLYIASLSEAENAELFGKCASANGHGHNYRVEPCVEVDTDASFSLATFEQLVHDTIIERFDHTHLNLDTREFDSRTGVNPTVENIARVAFELLEPAIGALPGAPLLRSITVWETDRTSATYPA